MNIKFIQTPESVTFGELKINELFVGKLNDKPDDLAFYIKSSKVKCGSGIECNTTEFNDAGEARLVRYLDSDPVYRVKIANVELKLV